MHISFGKYKMLFLIRITMCVHSGVMYAYVWLVDLLSECLGCILVHMCSKCSITLIGSALKGCQNWYILTIRGTHILPRALSMIMREVGTEQ